MQFVDFASGKDAELVLLECMKVWYFRWIVVYLDERLNASRSRQWSKQCEAINSEGQ